MKTDALTNRWQCGHNGKITQAEADQFNMWNQRPAAVDNST